ncbi:hypothetical protein pb186bvf_000988 [Paramecium bursaria]
MYKCINILIDKLIAFFLKKGILNQLIKRPQVNVELQDVAKLKQSLLICQSEPLMVNQQEVYRRAESEKKMKEYIPNLGQSIMKKDQDQSSNESLLNLFEDSCRFYSVVEKGTMFYSCHD